MSVLAYYVVVSLTYSIALSDHHEKVVFGKEANIRDFPHSALLSIRRQEDGWKCGASIVNQVLLLTAAHCVQGVMIMTQHDQMGIFAGHEDYEKSKVHRPVINYTMHPKFTGTDLDVDCDIALLFLARPLDLADNIKRVIISSKFPYVDEGDIAGWGTRNLSDVTKKNTILIAVKQKILTKITCLHYTYLYMYTGLFCAGDHDGGGRRGWPAGGDSGSALMAKFQQIGIVSFGLIYTPHITFYTNVSYYSTWIESAAEEELCD